MIIEITLTMIIIFLSVVIFYALRRINQYENLLVEFQQIVEFASKKMKVVDSKGHYESDDETGFFFEELKKLQELLDTLFETEQEKK
tara:strand:- start:76 stop:336 length:261 start_codon:yes stop_codon:yes gene_type:complete